MPQKDQEIHHGLKESKSESSTVPTTKNIRRLLILTAPLASLQENLYRNQNSATQGLSSLYQMRLYVRITQKITLQSQEIENRKSLGTQPKQEPIYKQSNSWFLIF